MDAELLNLLIVGLPNFAGLIVLSFVLWQILSTQLKAMRERIAYLETMLTNCLEGKFDESPKSD